MGLDIHWQGFKQYLVVDRKQSVNSLPRFDSCFKILAKWLGEKELNRGNFNDFIFYLKEKNYSNSYINNYVKLGKHLDRYLKTDELSDYTYFKEVQSVKETLSPEEITALACCPGKYIKLKKEKKARMHALILFLGAVGSRISETLALRKEDIISQPHPMVYFRPETTKNGIGRYCVIPKTIYDLLMALPPATTLFGLHDVVAINEDLKIRAKKCKISKNVYCHLFRHSSVNIKLAAGMPLELVTAYHGHSSTAVTYKYYVHLQQKQMVDALYMYDPFFKQGLTFELLCQKVKDSVLKIVDVKKFDYQLVEENGKLKMEISLKKSP